MTINYTEKGVGLHQAIAAAGYGLRRENNVWISTDDTAVQAIIDSYNQVAYEQTQICGTVDALFQTKLGLGFVYTDGKTYQIDLASQAKIAGAGAMALGVIAGAVGTDSWPAGFYWIAEDNTHTAMTAAQCYAFAQAVGQYVSLLVYSARAIKDNILAQTTVAAVDGIDITQGWPPNP